VLFIGARVGGWFNQEKRISITQEEYRHAYELQKKGKLKIITFVRAEVWQAREERKELAAYLASLGYNDSERLKIKDYPSKFADDAEFISTFTAVRFNLVASPSSSKPSMVYSDFRVSTI
jgi:hypothetical protein